MLTTYKSLRIAVLTATIALLAGVGDASAKTWAQSHPRRAEVNHRLAHQSHRINRELNKGEINRALHRRGAEWFWVKGHYVEGIVPAMPAAIVEAVPPAPSPAHVWVRGHWGWDEGRWNWHRGVWFRP